jgi:altronate dehydratase
MLNRALVLSASDNVATALIDLPAGERVNVLIPDRGGLDVTLKQDIPLGHKFALGDILLGAEVIKYGVPIGTATQRIAAGEHVHVHNLE